LYPLRFAPIYKNYVWGGDRIRTVFRRPLPPGIYAESWEVSDREEGMSVVSHGPLAGASLRELMNGRGRELAGSGCAKDAFFPLLIKIIDARERLSVQVHPDDASAARGEGEAKTEMWYALDGGSGGQVFAGLREDVTEAVLRAALKDGRLPSLLKTVPLAAGEAVFVPGGRVHAIDAGNLLLEVQQNSNTTYRLYDWDRVGSDGKPRPLHVEEALRVIHWRDAAPVKFLPGTRRASGRNAWWDVLACPHFCVRRLDLAEPGVLQSDGRSFRILFAARSGVTVEGGGVIQELPLGSSCLLPAALTQCLVRPLETSASVIVIAPGLEA
jgi:mannose-6-phosphate isomerase